MSKSKYRPHINLSSAGPRWWRRLHRTIPLRREAKRKLHRIDVSQLDEVQLSPPNKLSQYWW